MTTRRKIECWLTDMDGVLVNSKAVIERVLRQLSLWDRRDPELNAEISRILGSDATALGRDPRGRLILNPPSTTPPP